MILVDEVSHALPPAAPSGLGLQQICHRIARLAGLLRIHFAAEDRLLYPDMIASPDEEAARTARAFADEMGMVGPAFAAYFERWSSTVAVAAGWAAFSAETRTLMAALSARIERENDILYPMADALLVPAARAA